MVAPELDAITIRPGPASVAIVMNQRPDSRSNRTRPPKGFPLPFTDAKKIAGFALSTPSAEPDLAKERRRPFAMATNCVGPAAALPSGFDADVSTKRIAV